MVTKQSFQMIKSKKHRGNLPDGSINLLNTIVFFLCQIASARFTETVFWEDVGVRADIIG